MDTDSFTDSEVKSLYILKDRLYWTRLLSLLVPCGCLDCISCHHFWGTAQLGWSKYSRWLHQSQLIFQCGRMWAICAVAVIFYYIKTLIAKKYMWYQNSNYFVFIHFSVFFSDVANFSGLILFLQFIDIRLAVLGNVDAGKSTLLGVLTHDELDNGRGRARLNLFRHLHEIQSGRTSSISHEILGFNSKGEVLHKKILHST